MGKSSSNEGIQISGGSVTIGQAAAGRGATINWTGTMEQVNQTAAALEERHQSELSIRLRELITAFEQHRDDLPDGEAARKEVDDLATILRQDKPPKTDVLSLLSRLASGVGSVAALASGVEALRVAVTALL